MTTTQNLLDAERYEQYRICQMRGAHVPSDITLECFPPLRVCQFCGTHYRTEMQLIESNVPQRPAKPATEDAE